jgi:hypothetical protein
MDKLLLNTSKTSTLIAYISPLYYPLMYVFRVCKRADNMLAYSVVHY